MQIVKRQYATRCQNCKYVEMAYHDITIVGNKISLCNKCIAELSKITAETMSEIITKRSESKC